MLHVVRADGSVFRAPPSKVGVEGELYTKLDPTGKKNRDIERWFSQEIESPFAGVLGKLIGLEGIVRRYPPSQGDPAHRKDVEDLGFIIKDYHEDLPMNAADRSAIANYLAALVVRSPIYLNKLTDWHARTNADSLPLPVGPSDVRGLALENMLFLYDVYREAITNAYITLTIADCDREYLFADGGIVAKEPWSNRPLPFDLYAPLTPKLALNVLPLPNADKDRLWVARLNGQGVSRYNRMAVGGAVRFVFSKSSPPLAFIKKHFGVPAPAAIGSRWVDGKLETKYDRARDRPL